MSDPLEQVRARRAGLRAAIGRVESALAAPASTRVDVWTKEVLTELHELGEALDQHITINESDDGLLADIVDAAPRLAHRVDVLRGDHVQLRERLERAIDALTGAPESTDSARDRVVELLTALVRHRHMGADIVYEAYNVDIEAAD